MEQNDLNDSIASQKQYHVPPENRKKSLDKFAKVGMILISMCLAIAIYMLPGRVLSFDIIPFLALWGIVTSFLTFISWIFRKTMEIDNEEPHSIFYYVVIILFTTLILLCGCKYFANYNHYVDNFTQKDYEMTNEIFQIDPNFTEGIIYKRLNVGFSYEGIWSEPDGFWNYYELKLDFSNATSNQMKVFLEAYFPEEPNIYEIMTAKNFTSYNSKNSKCNFIQKNSNNTFSIKVIRRYSDEYDTLYKWGNGLSTVYDVYITIIKYLLIFTIILQISVTIIKTKKGYV